MNTSFYTAAVGASAYQDKVSVVANNMANINSDGYKGMKPVFSDLVYSGMDEKGDALQQGHGTALDKTNTDFYHPGALKQTGREFDFSINGDGFFGLLDPGTGEVTYTRCGSFQKSNYDGTFYLTDTNGRQVLSVDEEAIEFMDPEEEADEEEEALDLTRDIGIFNIPVKDGLLALGDGTFQASDKNGAIYVQDDEEYEEDEARPFVLQGMLEQSDVEMTEEMAHLIETQRNYQYVLKMIQTSDEIEQLGNELRR